MKREEWIDIARSIAMILVIFGHIGSSLGSRGFDNSSMAAYFMMTSAFKVPGFFAISGYLFHEKKDVSAFMKNKVTKILVPYLTLGAVNMVINMLLHIYKAGQWDAALKLYLVNYLKNFILGKNLWFIPCLFVAEILFYMLKRLSRNEGMFAGFILITAAAGYLLSSPKQFYPWRVDTAMICTAYMYIGYRIRQSERLKQCIEGGRGLVFTSLFYVGLLAVSFYLDGWKNMDINQSIYPHVGLNLLMIIVGIMFLFSVSKWIYKNAVLSWVGQNTLGYFMLHLFAVKGIMFVLTKIGFFRVNLFFMGNTLIVCVLSMVVLVPVLGVLNRFLPIFVGKS